MRRLLGFVRSRTIGECPREANAHQNTTGAGSGIGCNKSDEKSKFSSLDLSDSYQIFGLDLGQILVRFE
jgi:hypothetical protein